MNMKIETCMPSTYVPGFVREAAHAADQLGLCIVATTHPRYDERDGLCGVWHHIDARFLTFEQAEAFVAARETDTGEECFHIYPLRFRPQPQPPQDDCPF